MRLPSEVFQWRPCERSTQRRQSARADRSSRNDGADAEHHRLSAGAKLDPAGRLDPTKASQAELADGAYDAP